MNKSCSRWMAGILPIFLALLLAGCTMPQRAPLRAVEETPALSEVQQERDRIYALLAYAVVLKDWQDADAADPRGHNIGSVLVDGDNEVVYWARNSNMITGNGTQHGEVRLIRNYLARVKTYDLKDHTVYTTLEPCAMCSGMMVLTNVKRTVYGQSDPGFGKALERLALDSQAIHGYPPYPRKVRSDAVDDETRHQLDAAYNKYVQGGGRSITDWLRSDDAKEIYQQALQRFNTMVAVNPENSLLLEQAQAFLQQVPDHYVPLSQ